MRRPVVALDARGSVADGIPYIGGYTRQAKALRWARHWRSVMLQASELVRDKGFREILGDDLQAFTNRSLAIDAVRMARRAAAALEAAERAIPGDIARALENLRAAGFYVSRELIAGGYCVRLDGRVWELRPGQIAQDAELILGQVLRERAW